MAHQQNFIDEEEWDLMVREERILWQSEKHIRLRCASITPLEVQGLRRPQVWDGNVQCLNDAEKVQSFFGLAAGGTAACKRLLKWLGEHQPCAKGDIAHWQSVQFTLGKHLMLADRKQHKLSDDTSQNQNILECMCFSATSLMVMGCQHKNMPLWKTSVMHQTFCPTCSRCTRCNKFLA